jgi:hypothetical protein
MTNSLHGRVLWTCAGFFEVKNINPPPKSLGIHRLPVDTHNGDQITVEDQVRTHDLFFTSTDA